VVAPILFVIAMRKVKSLLEIVALSS